MNRKQLLILVVVLALLGGAALMLVKRDAASRQGAGGAQTLKLVADLPVGEELAQLVIRHDTNTLTLEKRDGVWGVKEREGYPANYSEISRTVLKLRDLKAVQTEGVGENQLGRLELREPGSTPGGGTRVEFRDTAGQLLASLLLGKQQMRKESGPSQFGGNEPTEIPVGRWVMNPQDTSVVALVSDTLSNLEAKPERWLNKDFFKVQKIKSIEVTYPEESTNSFKVSRETETGEWTIAGLPEGKELDTTKTSGFNYALGSPAYDDVIVGGDATQLGLDRPTLVTIDTFEGFHYDIKAGEKQDDGRIPMQLAVKANYARERTAGEDEDDSVKAQKDKDFADTLKTRDEKLQKEQALERWTYLVSSWTLDSVLKKRGDLLKEKEPEAEPEDESGDAAAAPSDPVEGLLDLPEPN